MTKRVMGWSLVFSLIAGVAMAQENAPSDEMSAANAASAAGWAEQENRYEQATTAIDEGRYREAIDLFRQLLEAGGSRQDAALYWIAYAHDRQGQRTDALETLAQLRSRFPASPWIDDAGYLEAEIRGAAGHAQHAESDDDILRMHALNSLMHADPERAMPILERILRGDESPEMKERAFFILLQGGEEIAFDLLSEMARSGEAEVRMLALQHLGMMGGDRALVILDEAYQSAGADDERLREAVLHGYMMAGDTERLMRVARTAPDARSRASAVHALAIEDAADELWALYGTEESLEVREAILHAISMNDDTRRLMEVVRTETEPRLREAAIHALAMAGETGEDGEAGEAAEIRALMLELYRESDDPSTRDAALQTLWMQDDAAALIELFEAETDVDRKRRIVEALSMMDSPEAVEFLIRLIEQ